MWKPITLIFSFIISSSTVYGAEKAYSSKSDYVKDWSATAVRQMISHKIPASITLAQGVLESSYGNSELARLANNHFGIKCHEWTGERVYQDDDAKGECFRKYTSADQSYEDHSTFLTTRSRYASLFDLEITDYKSWAHGLKKAGYATNPKYPDLLIGIIEDLKLYEYDKAGSTTKKADVSKITPREEDKKEVESSKETSSPKNTSKKGNSKFSKKTQEIIIEIEDKTNNLKTNVMSVFKRTSRTVLEQPNKVKYIKAKKGDTFYKIAQEFELTLSQIHRYNDFPKGKDYLKEGDIIYLQPKRKSSKELKNITLKTNMSVKEISQTYGVKTSEIVKKNKLSNNDVVLTKGQKVKL